MKKSIFSMALLAIMLMGTMSACNDNSPYPGYQKSATGLYYQAPFYKEMRDTITQDGLTKAVLNENIKSQRSLQFIAAMDYRFRLLNRPFKFSAEA